MRIHRQLSLAALVLGHAAAVHAANVGVGLTASALDTPDGFSFVTQADSLQASSPPIASVMVGATSGSSTALGEADVNGLTGVAHMSLSAVTPVPEFGPQPGRSALVGGGLSMTGSITLSAGLAPGTATFGGVLEGTYNGGGSGIPFANSINGYYSFLVGDTQLGGQLSYIGGDAGNLYIPLLVTMPVHGGEVIGFDMELETLYAESTYGEVTFDASHTFKLTTIDLPAGYTYTPDADGFLSQFVNTQPVPEPGTWALSMAGLALVVGAARRRRGV